jgi:hypothetical protein
MERMTDLDALKLMSTDALAAMVLYLNARIKELERKAA